MIKKLIKFLSLLNKKPAEEKNIDAYSSSDIISYYSRQEAHLQPAERTVLELLRTTLPQSTMLDIGVGAGRTTSFFAPPGKAVHGH
jgi:cyclopropane fatty-acyl-phospholipid synthase-like methyltransferase